MATNLDLFLKLSNDIKGESTKDKHVDEIDILSWQFTAQQPVATGGMGAATGKVRMSDITITKPVDKSSPSLFIFCCTGANITEGVITGQKATGDQAVFYKVTLNNVTITAITNTSFSAENELDTILESVTMNATKMKMEYSPILNGKVSAAVGSTYDFQANKKV